MTESETTDDGSHPFVVNGHRFRATKYRENQFGRFARQWECRSCGLTTDNKEAAPECADPERWVELGCPGDGLGVCRDCGAVFSFSYPSDGSSSLSITCPGCGGQNWERDNEAEGEVVAHV